MTYTKNEIIKKLQKKIRKLNKEIKKLKKELQIERGRGLFPSHTHELGDVYL